MTLGDFVNMTDLLYLLGLTLKNFNQYIYLYFFPVIYNFEKPKKKRERERENIYNCSK